MSLPPDPPHVNNNNYICLKYCPKGLDHLIRPFAFRHIWHSHKACPQTENTKRAFKPVPLQRTDRKTVQQKLKTD